MSFRTLNHKAVMISLDFDCRAELLTARDIHDGNDSHRIASLDPVPLP